MNSNNSIRNILDKTELEWWEILLVAPVGILYLIIMLVTIIISIPIVIIDQILSSLKGERNVYS